MKIKFVCTNCKEIGCADILDGSDISGTFIQPPEGTEPDYKVGFGATLLMGITNDAYYYFKCPICKRIIREVDNVKVIRDNEECEKIEKSQTYIKPSIWE